MITLCSFNEEKYEQAEFAQWAEYALDLRQKTHDGAIGIEGSKNRCITS